VRKTVAGFVAVSLLAWSAFVTTAAAQAPQPVPASNANTPNANVPPVNVEEVLKSMRADMQGARADVMAKNLTLTAEQAGKFWPVFDKYQKEQNVIMDEQLKSIQKYAETYQTLDAAGAMALITGHLDRDAKMTALRLRWLGEFQKVVPANIAARAMQIDRRLSMLAQLEISSQIPLVH
jgi:Spy/CpxP family protein refolding chaperone